MGQVALEGMEFYAYHGFNDEEQKLGNRYIIDLYINADLSKAASTDSLKFTVDYVHVYNQVQMVMTQKHRLLEHVGEQIMDTVAITYPQIESIKVKVAKLNPPIGGVCKQSSVTLEKTMTL